MHIHTPTLFFIVLGTTTTGISARAIRTQTNLQVNSSDSEFKYDVHHTRASFTCSSCIAARSPQESVLAVALPLQVDVSMSASTIALPATPLSPSAIIERPATPDGEAIEWRIIGITIGSLVGLSAIILVLGLIKRWWSSYNQRRGSQEQITYRPQMSLESTLAEEGGHRYPSLASLESIHQDITKMPTRTNPNASRSSLPLQAMLL
ncbi:hypothetical protein BDQ12DRAFT_719878 [Crucibulum laeve]|uniref:Mid2 domain-containing protein n=1 Tax=Crucibulum laeve TaxID=68775 RepID=A0A5C3ML25_9AGAR|nr:hypothetical protein BDQ12DRAFT_719878 [Crucibulum laeve]